MKAMRLHIRGGPEALVYEEAPQPHPQAGEVLVRVHAAAITPTELLWVPTWKTRTGEDRPFPIILGHEFSGVIAGCGAGVTEWTEGDPVYGLNDWFADGAQAEYCVAPAASLAPKPRALEHVQAAVVPISALTAWQALFQRAHLRAGQRVLIHGAAGSVGGFAVQFARWRGAHVIGTASAQHLDFVRALGADEVIDYRATRFEERVRDMDAVLDTVGGETLQRSWGVLKSGGTLVTIAAQNEGTQDPAVRDAFFIVEANRSQLVEIAGLIDDGQIRVLLQEVFPLAQARQAYARAQEGGTRGKVVLRVVR
jgi:NADPH:quinone reductase-like Zn-dependent oxidoreductase